MACDDDDDLQRYDFTKERKCGFEPRNDGDFVSWHDYIRERDSLNKSITDLRGHLHDARQACNNITRPPSPPTVVRVVGQGSDNVDLVLQILRVQYIAPGQYEVRVHLPPWVSVPKISV